MGSSLTRSFRRSNPTWYKIFNSSKSPPPKPGLNERTFHPMMRLDPTIVITMPGPYSQDRVSIQVQKTTENPDDHRGPLLLPGNGPVVSCKVVLSDCKNSVWAATASFPKATFTALNCLDNAKPSPTSATGQHRYKLVSIDPFRNQLRRSAQGAGDRSRGA